jgi:hypothetical protein
MKLSMTGQEKGDLLIRVGKKAGNTHISLTFLICLYKLINTSSITFRKD